MIPTTPTTTTHSSWKPKIAPACVLKTRSPMSTKPPIADRMPSATARMFLSSRELLAELLARLGGRLERGARSRAARGRGAAEPLELRAARCVAMAASRRSFGSSGGLGLALLQRAVATDAAAFGKLGGVLRGRCAVDLPRRRPRRAALLRPPATAPPPPASRDSRPERPSPHRNPRRRESATATSRAAPARVAVTADGCHFRRFRNAGGPAPQQRGLARNVRA